MLKHDASLGLLLMSQSAVAATVRVDSQVEIYRRQTSLNDAWSLAV